MGDIKPMFPLSNVVFPYMLLPLHIFEERYRRLMRELTQSDGDGEFGVVLISRGSEVGGGDHRMAVGSLVRLLDSEELDDGRWVAIAAGTRRIRVSRWLDDDPYPRAEIEVIEDGSGSEEAVKLKDEVQRKVRRTAAMQAELGRGGPPVDIELSHDPVVASFQACAVSPIGPLDAQELLEIDSAEGRLRRLLDMLQEEAATLELQLGGG
jgi:Lon protease-like protein